MKQFLCFFIYLVFNLELTASTIGQSSSLLSTSKWAFEENRGQVTGADSAKVTYFYKKGNTTMFLTKTGIAYQFDRAIYPEGYKSLNNKDFSHTGEDVHKERDRMDSLRKLIRYESYRMDIELLGANPYAEILREGESPDYMQYYNHNVLGVRSYQKITYKNIYPNIDWVIYKKAESTNDKGLTTNDYVKYDFIVHPGGNPADIKLKTHWVEDLKLNSDGSLTLINRMGSITDQKPISYQLGKELATSFNLDKDIISFNLPAYNTSHDLIIDPSIVWSTYYGGSGEEHYFGMIAKNAIDKFGNVYITGTTISINNIATGGYSNTLGNINREDAFLSKFDSKGKRIWGTYYGGNSDDNSTNLCIDKNNHIYMIGETLSSTMISYNGFNDTLSVPSFGDIFIVKFDSACNRIWATYYGGNKTDIPNDCSIDNNDNLILVGSTETTSGIVTPSAFQTTFAGGVDFLIIKFSPNGSRLWATYFGGISGDGLFGSCAVDKSNNIYFTGITQSASTGLSYNGLFTANLGSILVKLNSSGNRIWATYYPAPIHDCMVDFSDNVYIVGSTYSTTNIGFNGFKNTLDGIEDGYIAKFKQDGTRVWGTYYGGSQGDRIYCLGRSEDARFIYFAGSSWSTNNIFYNGFQSTLTTGGNGDGFIVKMDTTGVRIWGSYFGTNASEGIYSCNESPTGGLYISGKVDSPSTGLGYKGHQMTYGGGPNDCFLAKIGTIPTITISPTNTVIPCQGKGKSFTSVITNGGSNPQYQWFYQNQLVGTSANLTLYPSGSDTLYCVLTSNEEDRSDDTVWSNKFFVSVLKSDSTYKYDTICSNQIYLFNSQLLNTTGIYKDTFTSSSGCDSFIFLHLEVKPFSFSSYNHTTTCTNPSYFFNNQTFTQSGAYRDTFTAANGCDSFVTIFLTVKGNTSFNLPPVSLCPGQSYFFNGQNRTTAGTYTQTLTNSVGCDSIITLTLSYLTTPSGVNNIIWACNPYIFKGKTYTSNAIVIDTIKSSFGCDSLYRFNYIYLKSTPTTLTNIPITVCDSVTIKNIVHKTSFSYTDTTRTTQNVVCDSLYQTTNYTIKYTPTITLSTKQEDTFFKGENIIISANNIKNYRWSTGETKRDISFKLTQNESIFLIAWNDPECQDTAYTNITALDETILEFPTGFSPSSKKPENQVFRPNIVGKIERIQLEIFNRLGEKVYSSNNLFLLGWDGTYKGSASPQGVYTYLIEYVSNKRIFFKSGEVELVR